MNKTKILLIIPISTLNFGTKNAGGVDSVCQEILKQMLDQNSEKFEYRVLAIDPLSETSYCGTPQQLALNITVVTAPANEKIFYMRLPGLISQMIRIQQQINDFNPDIVHSHISPWLVGVSKPYHRIATLHAYKWICRQKVSMLNDFLYVRVLPGISNFFTDEYTCVGSIIKQDLTKHTTKPVHMIENPISEIFFSEHTKPLTTSINLVTCSVITPRKRLDRVISLVSELVDRSLDVKLSIIGPATDDSYFEKLITQVKEKELEGRITFLGKRNTFDIAKIYQESDFGVFLSEEETFGLAPLEMLASGLPVIATPVGILAEEVNFFSDNGVHYYDGTTGIESVIDFISTYKSSHQKISYTCLEKRFTPSSIVAMYESLYSDHSQHQQQRTSKAH